MNSAQRYYYQVPMYSFLAVMARDIQESFLGIDDARTCSDVTGSCARLLAWLCLFVG